MKKIRTILCGQRSFGAAVYGMLRKRPGIDLAAVYAPAGDKLAGLAELYHTPLIRMTL